MKVQNYIIKVATAQTIKEIYLSTLPAVKKEVALQKRLNPGAQVTFAKVQA